MPEKRVLEKIDKLEGYLDEIEGAMPLTFEEYRKGYRKRALERLLQVSIETIIDVCNLILKEEKFGVPSDEEDVFSKLSQEEVLNESLADALRKMRGFRNILVHRYGEVDDRKVFEFLENELDDFSLFISKIKSYLN